MLVQGVRNLQHADECKCRDIFIAAVNFGQLALKVANIGLEAFSLPHFDGEEMVVVLLGAVGTKDRLF